MNIGYCSCLLPEEKHLEERAKGDLTGVSLHKFTRAMIEGVDSNLDHPVKVFNIINTLNYPKFPQLIFHNEIWSHVKGSEDYHIGYINLFGIKYITQEIGLYRKLDQWIKSLHDEKVLICVHHIYYPAMKAALRIKHKYPNQVKTCLITGDMTGKYGLGAQNPHSIKEKMIDKMGYKIESMGKEFDCYVFATKYMAEGYDAEKKPFEVVECCYSQTSNKDIIHESKLMTNKKVIFYAGSLRIEYGIEHLLKAFELIRDKDFELWLAGGGNGEQLIRKYQDNDKRIKFFGFLTPNEVKERQKAATVLVSPRKSDKTFVKYSFPSKTMECLASGKPYIAHRLPCEPPEYGIHIQYPKDESDRALADKIYEICELDSDSRNALGEKARNFILEQKNAHAMTKKVVSMWRSVLQ